MNTGSKDDMSGSCSILEKENSYFRDKERLMQEQLHQQELQLQFLKERLAK